MPFKLTIELSDRDLRHFQRELKRARRSVDIADDDEILGAAKDVVSALRSAEPPDFICERLDKLDVLHSMLTDETWKLGDDERSPVLAALAYVCDPEDIIPDDIPGIGLLDDAVMIELVFRELRHEIEAYQDFCRYRNSLAQRTGAHSDGAAATKALDRRRTQLLTRMRRRHEEDRRKAAC